MSNTLKSAQQYKTDTRLHGSNHQFRPTAICQCALEIGKRKRLVFCLLCTSLCLGKPIADAN